MSIEVNNINLTDETIVVPQYLSDDETSQNAGISMAAAVAADSCYEACETTGNCQATCEVNCLSCLTCQTTCETTGNCQATCEVNCLSCLTCMYCETCQDTCESSCQNCQGVSCQTCQDTCESSCQNCEGVSCQTCQDTCQNYCQNCQGVSCQTCQVACQYSCQDCQTTCEITAQAPNEWTWDTNVGSNDSITYVNGYPAYLTALEWNNFTARINEFRIYKGFATISFTAAVKVEQMKAAQANEARNAINEMSPTTPVPDEIVAGAFITADFINGLSLALNSL